MRDVALTGNVASGKSAVAKIWADAGVPVVSADELSREAVRPGSPGLDAVRAAFGGAVLAADGTLDRAAMRRVAFEDDATRERLEGILHPLIWSLRERWLGERRSEGVPFAVSEIPLLFETGSEELFDHVVFVDAPLEVRRARLVELRGLNAQEADRVMAAQLDPAHKRAAADSVLVNDGTLEELHRKAHALLAELRAEAGAEPLRVDMHLHTAGSFDCLSRPEAVLERALERGLARIAITDHNRLHAALRMAELHPSLIIPGEEVKTAERIDVIGLYLSEEIPAGTPARETIERIREQGGIPYLPHPYAGGKGGGGRLADELAALCDVVEVFNARLHTVRPQKQAEALAARHGKLRGAGSDSHTLGEIGTTWVELAPHANHAQGLLRALEQGRPHGNASSRLVHLASTWAKLRKKLPGAPTG